MKTHLYNRDNISICHVLTRLDIGGMENGVVNICNRLDRSRFRPLVCCLNSTGPMASRLQPDVELVNMEIPEGLRIGAIQKVAQFFREASVDIVHTHAWGGGSFYGILGAKFTGVPIVINGEHGSFFNKSHQKVLQRILYSLCDMNLAVSDSLKDKVNRIIGIPLSRITVIPNGVDTEKFSGIHPRDEIIARLRKESFPFDAQSFYIISIGSLKPEKAPIMLLQGIKRLLTHDPSLAVKVIFVGDGPYREAMTTFIRAEGLGGVAFLLGNRMDIPELLSIADVLVSTSIARHEGLSNVMLEAMASGVPVIATRSVGAVELITDGVNGFLIDPDSVEQLVECLALLYHDHNMLRTMGMNAKELVWDQFSINRMLQDYEMLYLTLFRAKLS